MTDPGGKLSQELLQSAIQRILPHRCPFLLVDRVTEFVRGLRIAGIKRFGANDEAVQGYSPAMLALPGTILIEAVTQLGGILVLDRPGMADKVAIILQIPFARMIKPVQTGDTVRLQVEAGKMGTTFGEMRGTAYLDGDCVAEGQMRFAVANAQDLLPGSGPPGRG